MKTYNAEKPDAYWELAKETLAAYRQKKAAVPGGEQSTYSERTGCAWRHWNRPCGSLQFAPGCIP